MKLANVLEKFIFVDNNSLLSNDKRIAQVLIEIDSSSGLILEVDISWWDNSFV